MGWAVHRLMLTTTYHHEWVAGLKWYELCFMAKRPFIIPYI